MKLQNQFLYGIMCAGLAAGISFGQTSPTPQTASPAESQQTPIEQSTKPASQSDQDTTTTSDRNRQSDMKNSPAHSAGHTAGAAGTSDGAMVGKSDHEFMTKAAMGGMMEVQAAQMAQQKASSQEVKDYARKLEQDHAQANNKLKAIAQERQVSLPADISPEHKAKIDKLSNLSGADFDKAYMKIMAADHRKDVKEFEKASNRSMDTDLREFASGTLPTLKEHLQQAQQLNGSTRSRTQ